MHPILRRGLMAAGVILGLSVVAIETAFPRQLDAWLAPFPAWTQGWAQGWQGWTIATVAVVLCTIITEVPAWRRRRREEAQNLRKSRRVLQQLTAVGLGQLHYPSESPHPAQHELIYCWTK